MAMAHNYQPYYAFQFPLLGSRESWGMQRLRRLGLSIPFVGFYDNEKLYEFEWLLTFNSLCWVLVPDWWILREVYGFQFPLLGSPIGFGGFKT